MGAFQMKELSGKHKEVLRLSAIGMKGAEIEKCTGVSRWHQARIRNSEKGREFSAELSRLIDIATARSMAASILALPHAR